MKIRDLSEKGVLFVAQIRGKGGCFLTLEHEYVPFLGPRGGAGHLTINGIQVGPIRYGVPGEHPFNILLEHPLTDVSKGMSVNISFIHNALTMKQNVNEWYPYFFLNDLSQVENKLNMVFSRDIIRNMYMKTYTNIPIKGKLLVKSTNDNICR